MCCSVVGAYGSVHSSGLSQSPGKSWHQCKCIHRQTRVVMFTYFSQSRVDKKIMTSLLVQYVLFHHAGMAPAIKVQQQTTQPFCCFYNQDFSISCLLWSHALAYLITYLDMRVAPRRTHTRVQENKSKTQQDKARKKWHIRLLTIHYGY